MIKESMVIVWHYWEFMGSDGFGGVEVYRGVFEDGHKAEEE